MLCLGIETSCDETALALVRDGVVIADVMSSQADVHALFGGVVPELASREHYRLIGALCDEVLRRAGVTAADIDVVAVARGPGLLGSLLVGMGFAKGLALATGARLVGVNHLHAHLLAAGIAAEMAYPALGLLVSGGHTHIYRMESPRRMSLLGRTLDDAAGEAFDKVAKQLGLAYPGGRTIDELGRKGRVNPAMFPRPYVDNDNLDFSFSGLKTAAGLVVQANPALIEAARAVMTGSALSADASNADDTEPDSTLTDVSSLCDMCASFNHAVADTLRIKLERALARENGPLPGTPTVAARKKRKKSGAVVVDAGQAASPCPPTVPEHAALAAHAGQGGEVPDTHRAPVRALVAAGGVAANSYVREALGDLAMRAGLPLLLPTPALCTDNGIMVAHAGWQLASLGLWHDLALEAIPRGRSIPDDFTMFRSV
ncbi:tRNA (adenosine(37)-N6)-threonylcarbamoyltransferase complex transferase subunit TsaD [Nitratidesulfovibrio liaohensis]|uniref:tRNA (adenosine(37)-N6)-threonylcarbamoyltransferase complex transferase subunit TsaD n=1 Tax=Nitratidesulfovibrio liaohensis TaxID=2604158 RepID=UPI0014215557|nr:tRNA (adenosine(37)-N6)-threonylcarbamoyltransferase complex transferase subunit TsaD [Nitratidesulfovibrio liaohensis]NHZ48336.1 tRNA (adenosine(37)-N6)-threonylcarbamoyltransferase complex transferase subunit TsaD [Nitratidesulfovibrio liaohensis]